MTRVESKLLRLLSRASIRYDLIEPNDRVMVCMSGGKDSYAMLHLMRLVRRRVPFEFTMIAVNLDQGHPGYPSQMLESYFQDNSDDYRMLSRDTYSVVMDKVPMGKTYCSMCSRLRRGILYNAAVDLGCTKIALGHHRDDIVETLMLNLLYSGQLKAMAPKLISDDGRNVVIRPMAFCAEEDIQALADEQKFPIIPCNLCGNQENLQRQKVKAILNELNRANPKVKGNMFAALRNVRTTHLFDESLWEA